MLLENKAGTYKELRHNAAGAVPMGTLTVIEDTYAFSLTDIAAGVVGAYIYESEKVEGAKAGVAIKEGEVVYYKVGDDNLTNILTAAVMVGVCVRDAAIGDTNVLIDFDGRAGFLKA